MIADQAVNIKIDDTKLEDVRSIKYLGIIRGYKLKFGEHLNHISKTIEYWIKLGKICLHESQRLFIIL